MNAGTLNLITKWVFIVPWFVWAVWELVALAFRAKLGPEVKLISMEAKDLGTGGLTAVVYFWFGLGAHFWLNWTRPTYNFPWLTILFWMFGFAFLAMDLLTSYNAALWPEWMRWVRYTPLVAAFAIACGYFLFPQNGRWTP